MRCRSSRKQDVDKTKDECSIMKIRKQIITSSNKENEKSLLADLHVEVDVHKCIAIHDVYMQVIYDSSSTTYNLVFLAASSKVQPVCIARCER